MMILGIAGRKGSGKSTVAKHLEEKGFYHLNFADPLKDMIHALGIGRQYTHGDKKEEPHPLLCGKTTRHAMQTLGTEWGRRCIGEDFWVRLWLDETFEMDQVVADDVRFDEEAAAVRLRGGKVLFIDRPDTVFDEHPSERFQPEKADRIILNRGSITELLTQVEEFLANPA